MIRINDLNNFIETSGFSSISLASKSLEITQPALSESLGRFEKDLGFKVFYRTKNGISHTPEGRKVFDQAKQIQQLLASLGQEKETFPTVVLGCHSAVGSYFLPSFFESAAEKIPGYKIMLKHDLSRNIQMEIQAGRIDLGVVVNAIPHPDLVVKKIAQDKVKVWKAKKGGIQNQVIADFNLFQVQSLLKKWSKTPEKVIQTDSLDLIARMTAAGVGYGIIPERLVKLLDLDLVPVPQAPSFDDEFSLVHRPEFGKSEYESRILNLVKTSFEA